MIGRYIRLNCQMPYMSVLIASCLFQLIIMKEQKKSKNAFPCNSGTVSENKYIQ